MGLRILPNALLAAVFVVSATPRAIAADGPGPAGASLASLVCRVTKAEPVSRTIAASLLTVEVRNTGPIAAEPVVFELRGLGGARGEATPLSVRRVPDPVEGRVGRAVVPGGAQTYLLAVPRPSKELSRATARVASASFFESASATTPPVVVDGVVASRVQNEVGASVWESVVRLRNVGQRPVDALLLATCREPAGARLLLHRHLAGGEDATWPLRDAPLAIGDPTAPRIPENLAIQRVELVDWSVLAGDGGAGAAALARAWRGWIRWDDPFPTVGGRFAFRSSEGRSGETRVDAKGSFELDPAGVVTISPDGTLEPTHVEAVRQAIVEAFAPLRRVSPESAVAAASPSLLERGPIERVRCETPPSGERGPPSVWRIEDGVVRGRDDPSAPDAIRETWTTRRVGDGWLLEETSLSQRAIRGGRPTDTSRWEYVTADGRTVVRRYARVSAWTDDPKETSVQFDAVRCTGGASAPPVAASAPPDLRTAWDASYRYPAARVDLTARFAIETPGTDGVWLGERRVTGRLVLRGFAGMRGGAGGWRDAEVEVEGAHAPERRAALAAAVEDRLLIWAHRDFAGRAPFDTAFRGARVTPREGEPETYDVANGPCTRIRTANGRIADWDAPDLRGGAIEHARLGTSWVAIGLRRGEAIVRARFTDLGGGWLIPEKMQFERVFGADWGPETVTLSEIRVGPATED